MIWVYLIALLVLGSTPLGAVLAVVGLLLWVTGITGLLFTDWKRP